MFARLRQAFGPVTTPLDAVLGVSNPMLRTLFGAAYRGDMPQDEVRQVAIVEAQDAVAAGDPSALLIELWELYARWERWRDGQSPHDGDRRLHLALKGSTDAVFGAAMARDGAGLAFTDEQRIRALAACGQFASIAVDDYSARRWIDAVVREAAPHPDPRVHQALIAMFDGFFTVGGHNHDRALTMVEELLPLSGLARDDLQEIRAVDARTAALDAERDRVLAGLGAPLAAAMVAVLDAEQPAIAVTLTDAVQHPALRALADLSPEGRGDAFHRMLAFLSRDLTRCGEAGWHEVQKRGGRYHTAKINPTMPYRIGTILGVLATRKMVLTDADGAVAMFVDLLDHFPMLACKKVVDLLLDTVRAHPHGRAAAAAAAALRSAFPPSITSHTLIQFRIIIDETLRDLPPATGQGPGSEGPATGSGAPDTLAPPEIVPDRWNASDALGQHYDNLFDPRLYDTAHLNLLARLARLATDIEAAARESDAARFAFVDDTAAFAQRGFRLQGDIDRHRQVESITDTAAMGADLYPRFTAMQPAGPDSRAFLPGSRRLTPTMGKAHAVGRRCRRRRPFGRSVARRSFATPRRATPESPPLP